MRRFAVILSVIGGASSAAAQESSQVPVADAQVSWTGLRGTSMLLRDTDRPGDSQGIGLGGRSFGHVTRDYLTVQRDSHFYAAWSEADFEGEAWGLVRAGGHLPVGSSDGFVFRGGARAGITGNDIFLHTQVELPHAQVGYQWLEEDLLIEVAGQGGFTLWGHYRSGDDARRALNLTPSWGAEVVFHRPPFRADAAWSRFQARRRGPVDGPFDRVRGAVCLLPWKLSLCTEFRVYRADLANGAGAAFNGHETYQGFVTLGISSVQKKGQLTKEAASPD
ncbi:MAG: hypothetical protein AAGA56_12040 [Myxococcota bacterium]